MKLTAFLPADGSSKPTATAPGKAIAAEKKPRIKAARRLRMEKCGPAALHLLGFKKEGGKIMCVEVGESPTGP